MEAYKSLMWHEVSPGRYERDTDEAEQFYTSVAKLWEGTGHTYFAITSCVSISIPVSSSFSTSEFSERIEKALRSAWTKLRYDHPTLAAPAEYDSETKRCKKVYQTLSNGEAIEDWENQSFKVITEGKSGAEFANEDQPIGRYATLYLVVPPSFDEVAGKSVVKRDIVFRSHHDMIDGIGTLMLFNNLFEYMSAAFTSKPGELETQFGDEHKNLSPPFRIAACIPASPSMSQLAKLKEFHEASIAARTNAEVMSPPFRSGPSKPLNSQRLSIYLNVGETQAVLQKCKMYSATATHAFHTAIALAVRDVQPRSAQSRQAKYLSYALINLRRSCKEPYNSAKYAAAVYHSMSSSFLFLELTIPSSSAPLPSPQETPIEFLEALNKVRDFYLKAKVDEDYLSIVPTLASTYTPPYPETSCDVPAPNSTPSVSLSSIGLVDRTIKAQYGEISVDDPWVMGSEYGTGLGLFLKTWKGRLELSAGFNEAFHNEEEVRGFLESVKRWVLDGFGVLGTL
jgi:hypothetical protein